MQNKDNAIYYCWHSGALIVCVRVFGGAERPKVVLIRIYTDQWISGHFSLFALSVRMQKRPTSQGGLSGDNLAVRMSAETEGG